MLVRAGARLCLWIGLCCFAWPVAARAPILPGLSWVRLEGAESCISSIGLAQRIEDKLGRSVFVPTSAAELTIEGYVAPRADGGFSAHLAAVAMDGEVLGTRVLETSGNECQELDPALVLVIAVTLYPDTALAGVSMLSPTVQATLDQWLGGDTPVSTEPAGPPTATVAVPRSRTETSGTAMPNVTRRADPVRRIRLDVALIGGGGMLPSPAFGAEVAFSILPPVWVPLTFTLQGFWPTTLPAPENRSGELSFTLARLGVLLCPQQGYGGVTIEGCIGADTGVFYVASQGYRFDDSVARPVLDLLVQPNLRVRLDSRWSLRFGATIAVPLVSQAITSRSTAPLLTFEMFSVSPLTVLAHIGASLSL